MENFNIYGWSALHEACYKGYSNAVTRFLDYARETEKNLIELRTIDEYKTTPIIIAALGGHLEIVELLVNYGADLHAELDFQNSKHGIIEVAAIRQHIELLVYLNNKLADVPQRLRDLMISDKLDNQSRASVGRTLETLSNYYMNIITKLSKLKPETQISHLNILFKNEQIISYYTINHQDFGYCLATYLKLNENNEDGIASGVMTLLNVINDEKIRKSFIKHKGINYLVYFMENHEKKLVLMMEIYKTMLKQRKSKKYVAWLGDDDYSEVLKDKGDDEEETKPSNDESTWIECASIGQAFNALCKHDDCLMIINNDGFNEKIINYIKILFDYNNFARLVELNPDCNDLNFRQALSEIINSSENQSVLFEEYIGAYLLCLASLAFNNQVNKRLSLEMNLFELILNFWKQIHCLTSSKTINSQNLSDKKLRYLSSNSTFLGSYDYLNFNYESNSQTNQLENESEKNNYVADMLKYDDSKFSSFSKIIDSMSPSLVKNLKLVIIECLGKLLYHNENLKKIYIYPQKNMFEATDRNTNNQSLDWVLTTNTLIKTLLSYLDTINLNDKEIQLEVLRFIRFITDNDPEIQNRLVNTKNSFNSNVVNSFRNLLRKSSPLNVRTSAMLSLWSLSGEKNYRESHDRKCLLYRAVGVQKFVDALFDSDEELSLISLEALTCISSAPPYREHETNRLVYVQDDVAKVHAVPAVLRIIKSTNPKIVFATLKALSAMCVNSTYMNSVKNQLTIQKLDGISVILEIAGKTTLSNRLRCEAYFCLSMICLNNPKNRKTLYKILGVKLDELVTDLMNFLTSSDFQENKVISEEELEELGTQITAGLAFCGFCFRCDEFIRKIILTVGRIDWYILNRILEKLNTSLEVALQLKNKEVCFDLEKMRCQLGFLIAALHNIVNFADEDSRAIGMKIMVDMIPNGQNTYLRSIACGLIGRLVCVNDCLLESFISIGAIDILANSTIDSDTMLTVGEIQDVGEAEKGHAAVSLGIFTTVSPEARRNGLKIARKYPKVMEALKYYNEVIHIDLITQWNHFKELNDSVINKTNKNSSVKLKSNSTKTSTNFVNR